jgi:hypothetical protein
MHLEFTDKKLGFKVEGYFSTANYNAKKATTMIFINSKFPVYIIALPYAIDIELEKNKS